MYQQKIMEASCAIIVFDAVCADLEMIKYQKIEIVFCWLEMYFHNQLETARTSCEFSIILISKYLLLIPAT